jgi:hypothetical protein
LDRNKYGRLLAMSVAFTDLLTFDGLEGPSSRLLDLR